MCVLLPRVEERTMLVNSSWKEWRDNAAATLVDKRLQLCMQETAGTRSARLANGLDRNNDSNEKRELARQHCCIVEAFEAIHHSSPPL